MLAVAGGRPLRSVIIGDGAFPRRTAMAAASAFDVVIVGGGAAGCVVAARLAESPSRSVLLVEAGPDLRADLPAGFSDGWRLPRGFDWGYASEPDARGVAEDLRRGSWWAGARG
jgi:choline dehydrogenase